MKDVSNSRSIDRSVVRNEIKWEATTPRGVVSTLDRRVAFPEFGGVRRDGLRESRIVSSGNRCVPFVREDGGSGVLGVQYRGVTASHMAIKGKDGSAMRWIFPGRKRLTTLACGALAMIAGCGRLPYIDESKTVPHDAMGTIAQEDQEVKQANFMSQMAVPLPKMAPPRTTDNPEALEIWELTLQDAIRIGLENSETVRVISLGAQGIPVGGFEPTPLNTGAGAGVASALGAGTLATVYDPAIQETGIATALSFFDTAFTTNLLWGSSVTPVNNSFAAGVFSAVKIPVVFDQQTAQYTAQVQKIAATGTQFTVSHNINWTYTNSPINVYPSAYVTNTQMSLVHPLLGSAPLPGQAAPRPAGLEANRAPIVIARINADAAVWRFKASVMAMVRSIEQQYWALAQQHIQLWSRETAFALGEEILKRVQAEYEVGRRTTADLAEAQQNLERFRLDLVTATSDLITTERQMRNILGLPPADNRRIIPVTAPTEARLKPDWESSVAQMATFQPDIVQQQLLVRIAELQVLVARNQLLPVLNFNALYQFNGLGHNLSSSEAVMTGAAIRALNPTMSNLQSQAGLLSEAALYRDFQNWQVGFQFAMPLGMRAPMANVRNNQYQLLRQRAFLQQVVHQTTHSLARFFLEVDANYKQFKVAGRFRAAAAQRLNVQQAQYEVGRITIDRYLDSVSQWASAVAQEAQFKTSYNTSIVALEEAKGTLLAYDNIAVNEGPSPKKAYMQAKDQQSAHRILPIPPNGPYHPTRGAGGSLPDPVPTQAPPNAEPPTTMPLPAPGGTLPPYPGPVAPESPVGEPNILSLRPDRQTPGTRNVASSISAYSDTQTQPAAATSVSGGQSGASTSGPGASSSGASGGSPASGSGSSGSGGAAPPMLESSIDLPPLPK